MKRIIKRHFIDIYNFQEKFLYDNMYRQSESVIMQNKKPIAFYSRKLNSAEIRYNHRACVAFDC